LRPAGQATGDVDTDQLTAMKEGQHLIRTDLPPPTKVGN
jgi:hypothetical protein